LPLLPGFETSGDHEVLGDAAVRLPDQLQRLDQWNLDVFSATARPFW